VIHAGLVSRHLIRFARQASAGEANASHYSAKLRDPVQAACETPAGSPAAPDSPTNAANGRRARRSAQVRA
jgi:hypothetical protein